MIKINLLPHREEKRKKRQSEFYAMLGLAGTVAALVVILVGFGIGNKISEQEQRNTFIKT